MGERNEKKALNSIQKEIGTTHRPKIFSFFFAVDSKQKIFLLKTMMMMMLRDTFVFSSLPHMKMVV